jgi:hypothetical protein
MRVERRPWKPLAIPASPFNMGAALVAHWAREMIQRTIHVALGVVFALVAAPLARQA